MSKMKKGKKPTKPAPTKGKRPRVEIEYEVETVTTPQKLSTY